MIEFYLGRQPIYDHKLELFAYELLYRASEVNEAHFVDADQATSQVLLNAYLEVGLERLVDRHLAFVNLTRAFLLGDNPLPAACGRLVLEVLENIEVDAALVQAVRRLAQQGYLIALDDFIWHASLQPLVDLAHFVKIDVQALERDTVREHVAAIRAIRAVPLIAEKVETEEEFEHYKAMGFDYFQGFFFCRPNVLRGQRLPGNRPAVLRLLRRLQQPDLGVAELESLLGQDPGLSYRLLRYLHADAAGGPAPSSVQEALRALDIEALKTWVALSALTGLDDQPTGLTETALVRARMCASLAEALGETEPQAFFMAGLFAALDVLLGADMAQILSGLPLSAELRAALLAREGRIGRVLNCVLAYERGDFAALRAQDRAEPGCAELSADTLSALYCGAVAWADSVLAG